ncbi:hypothetical protein L6452_20799 [Arctium lappa]|uniref:Uncharacterized protein n=1 Tax=Arctium lappa TaxID=4217 RepID=A0ACB9BCU5_ARCLA|nr:hypothetical protein L6452_20799 [Arctium lappa]
MWYAGAHNKVLIRGSSHHLLLQFSLILLPVILLLQGGSQRKNAAMLDSDDTDSVSSSSTVRSDHSVMGSATEELHLNKQTVILDQSLDALYEKRGSTREKALTDIIEIFNKNLPHEFVENKYATLPVDIATTTIDYREVAVSGEFNIGLQSLDAYHGLNNAESSYLRHDSISNSPNSG